MMTAARRRREPPAGVVPLPPKRKWRAILLSTLLLAPGFWAIVIGLVAGASDDRNAPAAAPFIAFGLAIVPFVFLAVAFLSEHPRAPGATVRAMGLCLLVAVPMLALAGDAVTGLVAGLSAGGAVALRKELVHSGRTRAFAVMCATVYAFVVVRAAPEAAVIVAPVLPLTAIGIADHLRERRLERV